MNTLKNVLFFGLLLAVLCGVYLSLNRSADQPLPKGLDGSTAPVKIDLGLPTELTPPATKVSSDQESTNPPSFPPQPQSMTPQQMGAGGSAPPFQPPANTDPTNISPPIRTDSGSLALPSPPPGLPEPPAVPAPPGRDYPAGVIDPFRTGSGSGQSASTLPPATPPSTPPATSPFAALPPPPADHSSSIKIEQTMQQVNLDVEKNRIAEALLNLSQLYGNPDLPMSRTQTQAVNLVLDQMAAKVIYSRDHWLQGAYRVQAGDTLDAISDRCHVPALLLSRINGVSDPLPLGKELKVLKGPFSARISTDRSEMALWLDGRYAGRFNVALSSDLNHAQGMWRVRDKGPSTAAAGNRSGKQWMELVDSASGSIANMQATNDTAVSSSRDSRNTIWLSVQDMDDVFGILSLGSSVIIQR